MCNVVCDWWAFANFGFIKLVGLNWVQNELLYVLFGVYVFLIDHSIFLRKQIWCNT